MYEARSDLNIWEEAKDEKEAIQLKNTSESIQSRNEFEAKMNWFIPESIQHLYESIHYDWTDFVR